MKSRRYKIEELVKNLLPTHKKETNLVVDTCPFCGEKNMMEFNPIRNIGKCKWCRTAFDVLKLVMKVKNCTRQEAEEYINKNL